MLHETEVKLKNQLEHWLDLEECQLHQKSRELWLICGDRSNKFFYSAIRNRYCKNSIANLVGQEGNPSTDITKLRMDAPDFYNNIYNQDTYWNIFPKRILKRKLSVSVDPGSSGRLQIRRLNILCFS